MKIYTVIYTALCSILLNACASTDSATNSQQNTTVNSKLSVEAVFHNEDAERFSLKLDKGSLKTLVWGKAFVDSVSNDQDIIIYRNNNDIAYTLPAGRKLGMFNNSYFCGAVHSHPPKKQYGHGVSIGCFKDTDKDGFLDSYFDGGNGASMVQLPSLQSREESSNIFQPDSDFKVIRFPHKALIKTDLTFAPFKPKVLQLKQGLFFQQRIQVKYKNKNSIVLYLLNYPTQVKFKKSTQNWEQPITIETRKNIFEPGKNTAQINFAGHEIFLKQQDDNIEVTSTTETPNYKMIISK